MTFPELAHDRVAQQEDLPVDERIPRDIAALLRKMSFSNQYFPCWRPSRSSIETTNYSCEILNEVLQDESLCEAAERKILSEEIDLGMISAAGSFFENQGQLNVLKPDTEQTAELRNASSLAAIRQWIVAQRGHYDTESNTAPRDYQTALEQHPERFQRTGRYWNVAGADRRIYRETETGRYFYVDEGHPGPSAHLEVFDPDGKHLGEANISTGALNASKKDRDKYITI